MDLTEDLSARVLINHILNTEPPRTPFTRSASQAPSGSSPRRSSRLRKDAAPQTPQNILRRSLKHKIHESITRKSLPATKRRTPSIMPRKKPSSTSLFPDDGETPRHLLMNILQTDPVKSPVVHEEAPPAELQLPSADNTVTRSHSSVELSGLDLSDVTLGNVASSAEGLSRKRPRRSLNVSAFAKRLKNENEEESESSIGDHSLSLSSSTSLDLKTPFVEVHTEKRGLQRRVSNRRKITEEEFNAALNKQQMGDLSAQRLQNRNLGNDTNFEGITLGLSKLSEPDITVDIVNCHTALYDQQDAATSDISMVATQDKPTVFASQLQRDIQEEEEEQSEKDGKKLVNIFEEEDSDGDPEKDEGVSDSKYNDSADKAEPEDAEADDAQDSAASSKSEDEKDAAGSQTFDLGDEAQYEQEAIADPQSEDVKEDFHSEAEDELNRSEEEGAAHSQAKEVEDPQPEQDEAAVGSQTEDEGVDPSQIEEEEAPVSSHTGDEASDQFLTEEEAGLPGNEETAADYLSEGVEGDPQSKQDEAAVGPEDEGMDRSETEKKATVGSQTFDLEDKAEEAAGESQPEDAGAGSQSEEAAAGSQTEVEGGSESQKEEVVVNKSRCDVEDELDTEREGAISQTGSESDGLEQLKYDVRYISHRAYRSESGLILPLKGRDDPTEAPAGRSYTMSKGRNALGLNSSFEMGSQSDTGISDWPKPSLHNQEDNSTAENDPVGRKNASDLQDSHHVEISEQQIDPPAEEVPSEEEEEEWDEEDNDDEEFPTKTPAFVREKRQFFTSNPQASPSVLKNVQNRIISEALPAAKTKQVRHRKNQLSRKETVLPKTYLMGTFKHFAKTKVSADVFPVLNEIMDKFFTRVAEDLETYAAHAKRKTIEVEDVKLLLRRQGYINDEVPVEVLIEKYLRMEQRKILIPIATSGNVVIP